MLNNKFQRTKNLALITLAVAATFGSVADARGGGGGGGGAGARVGGGAPAGGASFAGGGGFARASGAPSTPNLGSGGRTGRGRGGFRYGYNGLGYGYGYGYDYNAGIYGDEDYYYNPAPTGQALDAYNEKQDARRAKLEPTATIKNYYPGKSR